MDALTPTKLSAKLVLTGFMAAGKSRALANLRKAGLSGVDTDELLCEGLGMTIAEFFDSHGEEEFRRRETELVLRVLDEDHDVVSLGGGAVLSTAVREALAAHTVVWLRIDPEELWHRVNKGNGVERPLARSHDDFMARYLERLPLYRETADAVLFDADRIEGALDSLMQVAYAPEGTRLVWSSSASGSYPGWVGEGILDRIPWPVQGRRWCISDSNVGPLYAGGIGEVAGSIEVEAGEQSKSLAAAERVWTELALAGATRFDHVAALGGGVVGDLAGFCAATYQRGMPVVQVPTTLVSQVDSAYGGKTGVDLPEAKNYVGVYHLPAAVITDVNTLKTLSQAELAAGYVELLKTALLAGGDFWRRTQELAELSPANLHDGIFDCVLTKTEVVIADERDDGRRETLNLGHTVGHAIETATGYGHYRHGEAVGLGLLAALRLSGANELRAQVREMLEARNLPVSIDGDAGVDAELIASLTKFDKKRGEVGVRFVLLDEPGAARTGQVVAEADLRAAVAELFEG